MIGEYHARSRRPPSWPLPTPLVGTAHRNGTRWTGVRLRWLHRRLLAESRLGRQGDVRKKLQNNPARPRRRRESTRNEVGLSSSRGGPVRGKAWVQQPGVQRKVCIGQGHATSHFSPVTSALAAVWYIPCRAIAARLCRRAVPVRCDAACLVDGEDRTASPGRKRRRPSGSVPNITAVSFPAGHRLSLLLLPLRTNRTTSCCPRGVKGAVEFSPRHTEVLPLFYAIWPDR